MHPHHHETPSPHGRAGDGGEAANVPRDVLALADAAAPVLRLLGDPTRLRLLLAMHYRGPGRSTVGELAGAAGVRHGTASAALGHLAAAGLVEARRDGRAMRYALVDETAHRLLHHLGAWHAGDGHAPR